MKPNTSTITTLKDTCEPRDIASMTYSSVDNVAVGFASWYVSLTHGVQSAIAAFCIRTTNTTRTADKTSFGDCFYPSFFPYLSSEEAANDQHAKKNGDNRTNIKSPIET